jgi:hypothetical protein
VKLLAPEHVEPLLRVPAAAAVRLMICALLHPFRDCVPLLHATGGIAQPGVPRHVPSARQTSDVVAPSPSSQVAPVRIAELHVLVPVHANARHAVVIDAQSIAVPAQPPAASQASAYVHASASSQLPPAIGVTVHVEPPLHVRVAHAVLVKEMGVPPQVPELQTSPYVQALPSSQRAAGRQAQEPSS